MNKYSLSKDDLTAHLRDQINFIIDSAVSYDDGFEGEAKRLAATIRILVHDTRSCSALLTQLCKMDILFFDSASTFRPEQPLTISCLLLKRFSKVDGKVFEADYFAPLDNLPPTRSKDKKIGFNRWWRTNIVFKDKEKNTFNRRDLVLIVADKEGGAHVDPKLDQAYANLAKFNSLAWKVYNGNEGKDLGNPVPSSIRQIAHEVIKTLKEGILDLFADKDEILKRFKLYEEHCLERNERVGFIKEAPHVSTTG